MHLQPNRNYRSDDVVQTPLRLARELVAHFRPSGRLLEPCKGRGNFLRALREQANANAGTRRTEKPKSKFGTMKVDRRGAASESLPDGQKHVASSVYWTEIQSGRDFFDWTERVTWIVTNPPWSQIRRFLQHAMRVADHVVFLMTINHVWTKARLRDIREAGFGLCEIVLVDMPPSFPQSGFQLGAVHIRRGWNGPITLTDLRSGVHQLRRDTT